MPSVLYLGSSSENRSVAGDLQNVKELTLCSWASPMLFVSQGLWNDWASLFSTNVKGMLIGFCNTCIQRRGLLLLGLKASAGEASSGLVWTGLCPARVTIHAYDQVSCSGFWSSRILI